MENFSLNSSSIALMTEVILGLILAVYLISIHHKSSDNWLVLSFVLISTLYNGYCFFYFSQVHAQQEGVFYFLYLILLASQQIFRLYVCYAFKGNPYPKEGLVVLSFSALAIFLIYYFPYPDFPSHWLFYFLMSVWGMMVLLRKAAFYNHSSDVRNRSSRKEEDFRKPVAARWKYLPFLHPPFNRHTTAVLATALWSMVGVVIWASVILFGVGFISHFAFFPILHSLQLVALIWLVILYINYSAERTTFLSKLVGLSLCSTLMLQGIMGFLLYGSGEGGNVKPDQHVLNTLAWLIPISSILILLIFPIFYKRILLRSLNQVLKGVQKVNEGELQVEVPVEVYDEIGLLGENFNRMTGSLRKYSDEMESLVAQRTKELEQSLKNLHVTQAQLIQAEKMASLGELTAGIAHEIQNPLNFVNNFSEVSGELVEELEAELDAGEVGEAKLLMEDLKQNLQKIHHHGRRADAIVKNMLQHSRASAGEKQLTNLNELAGEYLHLAYHGLRAKDKSFTCTLDTSYDLKLPKVEVVPQDLGRVLLNLLNNAFYAVQQKQQLVLDGANGEEEAYKPTVAISTRQVEGKAEIRVRDNGTGMPVGVQSKIFQPFFTTKPTGQGTGLGLSLSYDIITKGHGGNLMVESVEGEYTDFILQLPV